MLATEAEAFDCATCVRRIKTEALDDDNRDAWALWAVIGTRFMQDSGISRLVFERAVEGLALEDVADLADRLSVIYSVLRPATPDGPR